MASDEPQFEPALFWTAFHLVGALALGIVVLGIAFEERPAGLAVLLAALAAGNLLAGVGLAGAMMEPIPRRRDEGGVPLRLRASWGLLAVFPAPGVERRLVLSTLVGVAIFLPGYASSWAAGALLALLAGVMGRPRSLRDVGPAEFAFILLAAAIGCAALWASASEDAAAAWRGAAVLALLLPLCGQRGREVTALRWKELLPGVPPPPALDLSRYEIDVARKEAPRDLPPGVEAQLVDSGSFRVDPARMLEKLRQYQLRDPDDFLSAWLRCAVLSGARSIRLDRLAGGLTLRFDGRPFSASELASPYHVLLDGEAEEAERGRHFAYGLMALYRLRPRRVVVTSRGKGGVASMSVGGTAPAPATAPQDTCIRVEWPPWSFWRPFVLTARAWRAWGLAPARLQVSRYDVPDRPAGGMWTDLSRAGWRGTYRWNGADSRLRLYVHGTLVEELTEGLPRGMEAWLTHDKLRLDISQSAVVRGSLFDEGLRLLRRVT